MARASRSKISRQRDKETQEIVMVMRFLLLCVRAVNDLLEVCDIHTHEGVQHGGSAVLRTF